MAGKLPRSMEPKLSQTSELVKDKGVGMYSTKSLSGVPVIQRDGRNVLMVWEQGGRFATDVCKLLNEMDAQEPLLLNKRDRVWLKAIDRAFRRKVKHV
jgi:hypothetical protein